MSRQARQLSSTGLYHIVFRGVNRQDIFEDTADYEKMITILTELKKEMKFEILVYCFMSNHVHMLIKENNDGEISLIMKRLLTKYARWYNIKYQRSGALIANRYKSQPVEIDNYFLAVVRYIHQNPVRAKMAENPEDYKWSSYNYYVNKDSGIVDTEFVLGMINADEFKEFHKIAEEEIFLVDDKVKITDEKIRRDIIKRYNIEPKQIGAFDREKRNMILRELKNCYSIRQIERVTGISRGIVHKS